jgi:hypothetical protein
MASVDTHTSLPNVQGSEIAQVSNGIGDGVSQLIAAEVPIQHE